MDEFSFYHIVNEHSRKAREQRVDEEVVETVVEPMCKTPCIKSTKKSWSVLTIVRNIGYCIATIATAILGFGVMALFALIG